MSAPFRRRTGGIVIAPGRFTVFWLLTLPG